uniref:Uncharacterized protein n=1 Tax=Arundo donax TaxID=35708 RepID=A0A0A9H028_ARUDO
MLTDVLRCPLYADFVQLEPCDATFGGHLHLLAR